MFSGSVHINSNNNSSREKTNSPEDQYQRDS